MTTDANSNLPRVYESVLGDEELDVLFADLGMLDGPIEVIAKGGATVRASETKLSLEEALAALRAGAVRGVQVRYVHEGTAWCDTLLRLASAVRLVRCAVPTRATHGAAALLALAIALACVTPAHAQTAEPPADPPFTFRAGDLLFHPHLQVRLRGEERVSPYASPAPLDDEHHFVTTRFRVGFDATYARIRILLQAQDARDLGATPPGSDSGASFGVHQAYGEYRHGPSFVRLGRQEIAYGDERLIGPLDWTSAARSFDAIRGHYERRSVAIDAFGAIVARQAQLTYPGPPPTTAQTHGDYLGAAQLALAPADAFHAELLFLYRRDRRDATSPVRDRRISATSLRLSGAPARGLRYVAEGIVEFGEVSGERFVAYGAAADLSYTTASESASTVSVGGALGSGERAGRVGEFENFFPTNHKFYGFADLFGLRNLVEGHATLAQRVAEHPLTMFASAHVFFLEQPGARWTNAVGAVVAPATPGSSRHVGSELDLGGTFRAHDWVQLTGGYSLFVPGNAAERLGRRR